MATQADDPSSIPILPILPSDVSLTYLAEGAANIVYRISFPPSSPPISSDLGLDEERGTDTPPPTEISPARHDPVFDNCLLRLRKTLSSSVPNRLSSQSFHELFVPLFPPEWLVAQQLVRLPPGLTPRCNAQLRANEAAGSRPPRRRKLYLAEADEPHGVLVTDMSPATAAGEVLVEFKPKWLAQSPSAPSDARRCRTCALRALKNAAARRAGEKEEVSFCPLDLMSSTSTSSSASDTARLRDVARTILANLPRTAPKPAQIESRFVDWLATNPLLPRLHQLQTDLDTHGVLHADVTFVDFLVATTCRDCTVFLKIPASPSAPLTARLGDLDLKAPGAGKAEYWRGIEMRLIDEGWYTGTETGADAVGGERRWCEGLKR
ncbi:MAG: Inositol-pentakisphosphate 2-kinase [Piccolia ochrophora]|nr:MAG: Inositol-pentakisphosphate 2-kinase [Piccolia ochrophora]